MNKSLRFVGRHTTASVPRYVLYGDTEPSGDWMLNLEPLEQRCQKEGWVISPHAHPLFAQIIVVVTGGGAMTAEGETHEFSAPALIAVPLHTIHGFRYRENTSGWVLTIASHHVDVLGKRAPELSAIWAAPVAVSGLANDWISHTLSTLRALDQELDAGEIGGVIAAEAHLNVLLVDVMRQFAKFGELGKAAILGGAVGLVARYQQLIDEHYREGWHLTRYAQALNVTIVQLRAACLAVCDQAPLKLVHERILLEAKRNLIYSARSVAEVAYQVGFEDPAYFSRFFARHVGVAPAQFRVRRAFGNTLV
jgi:AraC family transcriptional activator of pobA